MEYPFEAFLLPFHIFYIFFSKPSSSELSSLKPSSLRPSSFEHFSYLGLTVGQNKLKGVLLQKGKIFEIQKLIL